MSSQSMYEKQSAMIWKRTKMKVFTDPHTRKAWRSVGSCRSRSAFAKLMAPAPTYSGNVMRFSPITFGLTIATASVGARE
eukprot:988378-Prymnesium_polylepis.1